MTNKTSLTQKRNVWLYMVDGRNVEDLSLIDSRGFDTWQANRHTRAGDLILMYRTAPFKDIAYVFVARSDARKVEHWHGPYAIDIADGYRLPLTIKLDELREVAGLKKWAFFKSYQGMMLRKKDLQAEGVWPALRRIIQARAPGIAEHFGPIWTGKGRPPHVFLSYASQDKSRAEKIYYALSSRGIDVWLDQLELRPADDWNETIRKAIVTSRAFVVCLSKTWIRRSGYVKKEIEEAISIAQKRRKRFLFPVKVENCRLPKQLAIFQATQVYGRRRNANLQALAHALRSLR